MKTLQDRLRDAANTGISAALEAANKLDAQEKLIDELRAKLAQHDEPVGVARTNAMLKQGDTFCVFELGSVPEGTKLYTRPQPAKVTPGVVSKTTDTIVPDAKDEIDHEGIWTNSDVAEQRYIQGWNDCRAAMLKGEK